MTFKANAKRAIRYGLAVALLSSCAPAALHADTSNAELAKEIAELKAQIRAMRGSLAENRAETRRTSAKVRAVAEHGPAYALPPPGLAIPVGAVPAFVTQDKKLQFGTLTITPGGFVALESVFRSRTEQADIGTAYQAIPFGPLGATNEFRFSARQSRISGLVEAPISPTMLVSGYGEFDFLGSGVTSNENESNSFTPRIRHLYMGIDSLDTGLHLLAGQDWSLATLNSKGITPRNEVTPPTIDAQYVPGFTWKRQPQIRLTKDFGKRLWLSVSAEEPEDTYTGCTVGVNGTTVKNPVGGVGTTTSTCQTLGQNNLNGVTTTGTTSGGTSLSGGSTSATAFSLNHVPDVVGKIAYEAPLGDRDVHIEGFGMYRDLYDRVAYLNTPLTPATGIASNRNTTGWGAGGGLIVPVVPKKLDFQASGMVGRGIGSYGTAQFSDATLASNGSLSALREEMALAGLILHATPSLDVYGFGGLEQVHPDFYSTSATAFSGYGVPTADNSGCFNYAVGGACSGNSKRIWQATGGFWDKLYYGAYGEVRVGVQYSYTKRDLFAGTGFSAPATAALVGSPKTDEQTVMTSIRYYPFASPPVAPVIAKY